MIRWYRRARPLLPFALLLASLRPLAPPHAAAQDEVIADPELERSSGGNRSGSGDEEMISDPELEGGGGRRGRGKGSSTPSAIGAPDWGEVYKPKDEAPAASAEPEEHDPMANTGVARLEAIGLFGADIHHEGSLEDAYETRLRFDAEVDFRRSRKLRMSIGLRTDLYWAVPARTDGDLLLKDEDGDVTGKLSPFDEDRFELDLIPLSAYVDVTPVAGLHFRLGEQPVSMARMDGYSPIDMLAVYDGRGQQPPSVSGIKLAQPALRMDWDMSSWATLQIVYLPWFMPNLSRPNRDRYVGNTLGTSGPPSRLIDRLIDPSYQPKVIEDSVRFVGPAPDFTTPQAAARLTMRGSGFEFGFSGGTALEKLASLYETPVYEKLSLGATTLTNEEVEALQAGLTSPLIDVQYHRYYQVGVDGSFDIGAVTIAFEFAYSPARYLLYTADSRGYQVDADGKAILDSSNQKQYIALRPNISEPIRNPTEDDPGNVTDSKIRRGVPVVQGALHLEWAYSDTFVLLAEGYWLNALQLPYDKSRDWLGARPGTGAYLTGVVGMNYQFANRWSLSATVLPMVGPSLMFVSMLNLEVVEGFSLNAGLQIFEGPPTHRLAADLTIGGLFSGYDQLLFGFRYTP